jgi:predicted membrane chloride channel (bestrophin family)
MASASTEIAPFFATPHLAPIELPGHVLTMIILVVRDSTSAAADAEARSLYAGLMGGIGSVCRSWRRLVKGILMGDELVWLTVQGAAEAAECLSSFPHAKSLHIVGDAAAGEIVAVLGSRSVARLAIANNSVVRHCKGLGQLVGLRALYITECRNLAPSLERMTQLTSLDLRSTLRASAGLAL